MVPHNLPVLVQADYFPLFILWCIKRILSKVWNKNMILYGIPTCDTCKKARKALEAESYEVTFRDVRNEPLSEDEWAVLLHEFGSTLVNQKSTTYRGLSIWLRESEADAQLIAHPTLMKRPILQDGDRLTMGWKEDVQAIWLHQ